MGYYINFQQLPAISNPNSIHSKRERETKRQIDRKTDSETKKREIVRSKNRSRCTVII